MNGKHPLASRTLWLNLVAAALAVLEAQFHLLQPELSASVFVWGSVGLAASNVILRAVTTQPLSLSKAAKP